MPSYLTLRWTACDTHDDTSLNELRDRQARSAAQTVVHDLILCSAMRLCRDALAIGRGPLIDPRAAPRITPQTMPRTSISERSQDSAEVSPLTPHSDLTANVLRCAFEGKVDIDNNRLQSSSKSWSYTQCDRHYQNQYRASAAIATMRSFPQGRPKSGPSAPHVRS